MRGISQELRDNCRKTPERMEWLARLPGTVRDLSERWSLTLGTPFEGEVSAAWVMTVTQANGNSAVLKVGMPHMESSHEIQGLRFWNGDPTVRLIKADESLGAMLIERCEPGYVLRTRPEPEQDSMIAHLLRRLWRSPFAPHPFRPLSDLLAYWGKETLADIRRWPDAGLVEEGLRFFEELPRNSSATVLLATDLHAGMFFGRSVNHGSLSIRSRSSEIQRSMPRNTYSTAPRDLARTLTRQSTTSPISLRLIVSAFDCGCSRVRQPSRETTGNSRNASPWHEKFIASLTIAIVGLTHR